MQEKLLETLADIAYIAGESNYFSGESRYDISQFIAWAREFEVINESTDWEEFDYILTITVFTLEKLATNE